MAEPDLLLAPLKPASVAPRLWTGAGFVADTWHTLGPDDTLPIEGRAIVSLARWRAEQASIAALGVPVGVKLLPGEALDGSTDDIARLGVIALVFPKFTDGRAYSTARHLRDVLDYRGEIRATGDVLLDQLPLMLRCGFNAFEIVNAATLRALEQAPVPAVSRIYQRGAEVSPTVWRSRRATG